MTPSPEGQGLALEDAIASKIVLSLLRLAQQARLYDADNEAQRRVFDDTAKLAAEYGHVTGRNITIFLSPRAVYVGRRLLRASRSVYAAAGQLREQLAGLGASQITIGYDVPPSDLRALQEAFRVAQQEPGTARPPRELARIRLRVGRPPGELAELDALRPEDRAVKIYTLAIVVLRRFFAQLQAGDVAIPGHMRHIAVHLAELSQAASPAFLSATVARPAHDDAGRAVATALLSACVARLLDADARSLERLVMAALLCDVGKPHLAGIQPTGEVRRGAQLPLIPGHMLSELPGATAVVTTALGKMTDAGMVRSVLIYEALHLCHAEETGPVYAGERAPTTMARIIARARCFQEALDRGLSISDAMAEVVRTCADADDRAVAQLMMAVLCVFPSGTDVELSSGQQARIVTSAEGAHLGRPVVSVLDGDIAELIDLSAPAQASLRIVRVISLGTSSEAPPESSDPLPTAERETAKPPPRRASLAEVHIPGAPRSPSIDAPARDDDLHILVGPRDSSSPPSPLTSVPPPSLGFEAAVPFSVPPGSIPLAAAPSLRPTMSATAEGSLAKTPVTMLLLFMLEHRLTGTLLLASDEQGHCGIYFLRGEPCKVRAPAVVSPLGPQLVRMGLIDARQLTASQRAVARSKQLLGQYLVARKLVTGEALHAALKQQLINKIAYAMRYEPSTRYAFYDEIDLLADYGGAAPVPCEPLSLVMMGVRGFTSYMDMHELLASLGDTPLALHPDADPERLGLTHAERPVLDRLRQGPANLVELFACAAERDARHAIYALVVTRSIDLSNGTRAPVGYATG